jgi:hypothetical protein
MIDAFLKLLEDDTDAVDIKTLFRDKEEQISWEKMVNVFDAIQIDNVTEGLKEVIQKYKLTRQEELTVLAYVKFLETMVYKVNLAKDIIMQGREVDATVSDDSKSSTYSGSMFG